jgi:crossover junction endodeoxyribonuclease RusA
MSAEGRALKQSYQIQAKAQYNDGIIYKALRIEILLYFKDKRRRDWDNFHKLSMDALNGIVWADNNQIKEVFIKMLISKQNPRIELTIEPI